MVSLLLLQSGVCRAGEGKGKDQHGRLWILKEEEEERPDEFTGRRVFLLPVQASIPPMDTLNRC